MPKLKKPTPKPRKALYDYSEVISYIERKYKIDTRDYAGRWKETDSVKREAIPYQDFWHWVVDHNEVHNGCDIVLDSGQLFHELSLCKSDEDYKTFYKYCPKFVLEIMKLIQDEFGDEVECWVSW